MLGSGEARSMVGMVAHCVLPTDDELDAIEARSEAVCDSFESGRPLVDQINTCHASVNDISPLIAVVRSLRSELTDAWAEVERLESSEKLTRDLISSVAANLAMARAKLARLT